MADHDYRALPKELILGLPEIDAQHDAILESLLMLKEKVINNGHLLKTDAEALLAELSEHYATEARIAADFGVDFSAHAGQHGMALLAVEKTLREVLEGRANVFNLLRYLDYWFERHIAKVDSDFAEEVLEAKRQRAKTDGPECSDT